MILAIVVLTVIVFAVLVLWLLCPMQIPRDASREGIEDEAAARAYYRVSRWPLFVFIRYIVSLSLAKMYPAGLLIDLGGGSGFLVAHIGSQYPGLHVVGLDISGPALKKAGQTFPPKFYPRLEFVQADAQQIPCADNSVDFIISSLSLHHWADAQSVFREIVRVLKPGGKFLVFDLRRNSPVLCYLALRIGQYFIAPAAIRRINGGVGSFWASYTPAEIKVIFADIPVDNFRIESGLGWMYIMGSKPSQS